MVANLDDIYFKAALSNRSFCDDRNTRTIQTVATGCVQLLSTSDRTKELNVSLYLIVMNLSVSVVNRMWLMATMLV